ncbi:hypothetical protein B0F88_111102 [Methylobacter tundripaludum]|uniref:Uncharacterized protein n=1 Tax=Methylobacter tundripaludum TaxID=173365 RepID=A0A2S6GU06_9GAMM|nr:hypothetical protein [Methylobacter tundripaludum]PPK68694.1 hypothetical protein B0F88_111102 [Methylobacter tundripaludum]
MNKIIRYFYLTPKDIGIQTFELDEMVELMKADSNDTEGPLEFASTIYDIFESKKKNVWGKRNVWSQSNSNVKGNRVRYQKTQKLDRV